MPHYSNSSKKSAQPDSASPAASGRCAVKSANARSTYPSGQSVGLQRQAGLSMFGFLLVLIILAAALNFGLTLGPHYMENRSIVSVVEGVDPQLWGSSKKKAHVAVNKGLKINQARSYKSEDIVKIEKVKGATKVTIDYEVRENMFANLDVVLVFNKDYRF